MTVPSRYARHVALEDFGESGQVRLGASRMLIVGLGGLGCPAAQYLAGSGAGRLVLNDYDIVDETNLPRQVLYGDTDIGALKVDAAARRIGQMNSSVAVSCVAERLDDQGLAALAAEADVVLDCTDNFTTRLAINRACVAERTPLVSGAALRYEGQLCVFENAGGGPCYRCVYSEEDEMLGSCQGNGVLAPVPGVIGALMAVEAIQIAVHGRSPLAGRLQLWDATHGHWQSLTIRPDPDCPVCGV
jgi:molybdopterin/thiamine biosynthesis adenylyltransferase